MYLAYSYTYGNQLYLVKLSMLHWTAIRLFVRASIYIYVYVSVCAIIFDKCFEDFFVGYMHIMR